MEFLQLIETVRAEDASRERLLSMGEGFRDCRSMRRRPDYNTLLSEAMQVLLRARGSRYGMLRFEEAMQTGDFPLLMGDVLDRQLLGRYAETPVTWPQIARRSTVPDFRVVKRFAMDGAEGVLPKVAQDADYQPQVLTETKYEYSVEKRGRLLRFSWEAFINDDLGALGPDSPDRMGRAARRSEEKFATELHVDSSGPHASLYTTANKNIINTTNGAASTNPALSIPGLQDAITVLGKLKDADGEPITVEGIVLEVGPALKVTAENIMNATQIWTRTSGGGTTAQEILARNWMAGQMSLVVNSYIPVVATTNGDTSWFVFASPSAGRPALEMGFLRGNEAPALFQKLGNQQRLGGGTNPLDGSFENDSIEYKIRHVFGGTRLDGKATVASNGSGS